MLEDLPRGHITIFQLWFYSGCVYLGDFWVYGGHKRLLVPTERSIQKIFIGLIKEGFLEEESLRHT